MNNSETKIEFIFSATMTLVSLIAFLFLLTEGDVARSGIIYMLPCFSDCLRTVTIDKDKVSKTLVGVNIAIIAVSSICITLCVAVVLGIIEMNIVINVLFLSYFIKNLSHSIYYFRRY